MATILIDKHVMVPMRLRTGVTERPRRLSLGADGTSGTCSCYPALHYRMRASFDDAVLC
jgi:hypothetical protein